MALPGKKKIVIDGIEYRYVLKFGKSRLIKETPFTGTITIQISEKNYVKYSLTSKLEPSDRYGRTHKNSFTPRHVESIIRNGLTNNEIELDTWIVCKA